MFIVQILLLMVIIHSSVMIFGKMRAREKPNEKAVFIRFTLPILVLLIVSLY